MSLWPYRTLEGFFLPSVEFQKAYNIRCTIQLAQEGAYGKATKTIQSDGVLPPSQEVASALAEKHPQSCPGDEIEYTLPTHLPAPLQVLESGLLRAIMIFHLDQKEVVPVCDLITHWSHIGVRCPRWIQGVLRGFFRSQGNTFGTASG